MRWGGVVRRWAGDPLLVLVTLALSCFGIVMIYSAGVLNTPSSVTTGIWMRQAVWLGIALILFSATWKLDRRWLEWSAYPLYAVALALLASTLIVGTGAGTAEGVGRWIAIGSFRFQPAELGKLAVVLALARYLSSQKGPIRRLNELVIPGVIVGLPLGLVVLQPDLGTALAFIGILFFGLYWAGASVLHLALLASPAASLILSFHPVGWLAFWVGLVLLLWVDRKQLAMYEVSVVVLTNLAMGVIASPAWNSLATYQQNRLLVFLDPSIDPRGAGWNLIQSKVAIGSGGVMGSGLTQGTQKGLNFLPEQHTDFIFSVVGEELGFLGVAFGILLFWGLIHRLILLARRESDPFVGSVLVGIAGIWIVHVFVNIGMTVGVSPITGIPLPFLSYGGTFLVTCWILTAVAARVSSNTQRLQSDLT